MYIEINILWLDFDLSVQASGRYKLGPRRSAAKVRCKTGLRSARDPPEDTLTGPTNKAICTLIEYPQWYYFKKIYCTFDKIWVKAFVLIATF